MNVVAKLSFTTHSIEDSNCSVQILQSLMGTLNFKILNPFFDNLDVFFKAHVYLGCIFDVS